ncbi:MAG: O-antigen ligase family protein [Candidatus Sumerlaeia bacterium]
MSSDLSHQTHDSEEASGRGTASRIEAILLGAMRCIILCTLAVTALLYPLNVPRTWTTSLESPNPEQIQEYGLKPALFAFLHFGYSPLLLKETVAFSGILLLAVFWIIWRVLIPKPNEKRRPEIWLLFLFLIYLAISTLRAPHFGLDIQCLMASVYACLYSLFFIILIDLPPSKKFRRASLIMLLAVGLIIMIVSILQANDLTAPWIFQFMKRFAGQYNRNLYGSLIGHNTGAASMGMGPWFFALGLFFVCRKLWQRLALGCFLAICLCFFIVAQSRSIWIFALVLTPLFVMGIFRIREKKLPLRRLLMGFLVFILFIVSQVAPWPLNFMHLEQGQYAERLRALTPAIVLKGTRVRILVVSGQLIAARPILGHGLDSFSLVYPHAQARYFSENPDTFLQPTTNQTARAHNDFLQLFIETGAVGFFLALVMLYAFFRRARKRFQEETDPATRVFIFSAFFAVLALLLHALVDFPFHIAPLALFFIFYAALAYGHGDADKTPPKKFTQEARTSAPAGPRLRYGVAAFIGIVLLAIALIPAISPFAFAWNRLKADRFFTIGVQHYLHATEEESGGESERLLAVAREYLRQSLRVSPLEAWPHLYLAYTDYQIAQAYMMRARQARRNQHEAISKSLYVQAMSFTNTAIEDARRFTWMARPNKTLRLLDTGMPERGPRLNDRILELLARSWMMAHRLNRYEEKAIQRAFENLRLAIYFSPAQVETTLDLIAFMQRYQIGRPREIPRMIENLARYVPEKFQEHIIEEHRDLLKRGHFDRAVEKMQFYLRFAANISPMVQTAELLCWTWCDIRPNPDGLRRQMAYLEAHAPEFYALPVFRINLKVLEGRLDEALELTEKRLQEPANRNPAMLSLHAELLRQNGKIEEAEKVFKALAESLLFPGDAYSYRAFSRRMAGSPEWIEDAITAFNHFPMYYRQETLFFLAIEDAVKRGDEELQAWLYEYGNQYLSDTRALQRYAPEGEDDEIQD